MAGRINGEFVLDKPDMAKKAVRGEKMLKAKLETSGNLDVHTVGMN